MRAVLWVAGRLARLRWRLVSLPIGFKILGLGAIVAALFGTVTLHELHTRMAPIFAAQLKRVGYASAQSLRHELERPLAVGDSLAVHTALRHAVASHPDVRYALVLGADMGVIAHTFEGRVPPELLRGDDHLETIGDGTLAVYRTAGGHVVDVSVPVLRGRAGWVRLGIDDAAIAQAMASLTRPVRLALAACALVGAALALALTFSIARPIRHLAAAANELAKGNYAVRARAFAPDEIGKLALAFNQMVMALGKQRAEVIVKEAARQELIGRVLAAQESERTRIARDLHDQLGQSLSAMLLEVHVTDADETRCVAHRAELDRHIRGLIDEVRHIAWALRPSILDDHGLEQALARHVQEVARAAALDVDYQYAGPEAPSARLPERIETIAYRIAQEALTNVVRHARAGHASVVLVRSAEQLRLTIEDDGVGFDVATARGRTSDADLGLVGMEERTALVGGKLSIESRAGRGTTVTARIPLEGAQT